MADCAVEERPSSHFRLFHPKVLQGHYADESVSLDRQESSLWLDLQNRSLIQNIPDFEKQSEGLLSKDGNSLIDTNVSYDLRLANIAQVLQAILNGFDEWGSDYPDKAAYFRSMINMLLLSQFAKNVKFYLLVLKGAPINTLEFLSHCMVHEREAYIRVDNAIQKTKLWTISYVFVPSKHRGSGYSKILLQCIQQYMKDQRVFLSTLYSDIGANFYGKLGWIPEQITEWKYTVTKDITNSSPQLVPFRIIPITPDTIPRIIQIEQEQFQTTIFKYHESDPSKSKNPVFSIMPTVETAECDYLDMLCKYASKYNLSMKESSISIMSGILIQSDTSDKEHYILWNIDVACKVLLISRIQISDPVVFTYAMKDILPTVALSYGLEEIVIWNQSLTSLNHDCPTEVILASVGYENLPVEERIPCLYYSCQETGNPDNQRIVWVHNEPCFWF
jgi:hypothetical protein